MTRRHMLALFIAAGSIGCASAPASGVPQASRDVITEEQIAAGAPGNAFEVISRLRPNFLLSRGSTTLGNAQRTSLYPNVYVDGLPYGDINSLRNIDGAHIAEIRMYQAAEAQTRFGLGNSAGVIAITIRR